MNSLDRPTVHVTVSCAFCDSTNDLTLQNVHELLSVACSCCGAPLGTVKQITSEVRPRPKLRLVS
jgi:hypothetical protein